MTPDDLRTVGAAIYGADWQRPMARALGPRHPDGARESIDDRLVRRWASGARPIPNWVSGALLLEADAARERLQAGHEALMEAVGILLKAADE